MAGCNEEDDCKSGECAPAYAAATNPVCVESDRQVDSSTNYEDDPVDPVDESPDTPDCFAVVFASSSDETLQTYNYDEPSGDYNGNSTPDNAIYDSALGWIIQTGQGSYMQNPPSTSPYGTFCSSNGDVVTTIPCDKNGVVSGPQPECAELVFSSNGETLEEFTYDASAGVFTSTSGDQTIELNDDGLWELATPNGVYVITEESIQPFGTYCNDDGVVSIVPCGK